MGGAKTCTLHEYVRALTGIFIRIFIPKSLLQLDSCRTSSYLCMPYKAGRLRRRCTYCLSFGGDT